MNATYPAERLQWIDTAKGIGIFLVVLGHAIRPGMIAIPWCDFLFRLIYAFHMPLFFLLSGYTFAISYARHLNAPGKYTLRRAKTLLVPFVCYAALVYLCFFIAYRLPVVGDLLASSSFAWVDPLEYAYLLFVWENPYAAHLWYIWVLFAISLIAFALAKFMGERRWRLILAGLSIPCLIAAILLPIPTAIRKILAYLLFFAAGIWWERYGERLLRYRHTLAALAGGAGAVVLLLSSLSAAGILSDGGTVGIAKNFVLALAAILVSIGVILLSQQITNLRLLTAIGQNSFAIYLLHQPFCCAFAGILLYDKLGLPTVAVLAICTALSFALPALIAWIVHRIRWVGRITKLILNI